VFILQKRIIRIITNTKPRDSCREVFKNMEIMTLYSQYIYSLISLGNKMSLFFLAHEGKYQILIELLTLNSNM